MQIYCDNLVKQMGAGEVEHIICIEREREREREERGEERERERDNKKYIYIKFCSPRLHLFD